MKTITAIGIALGEGAGNPGTKKGAQAIESSSYLPSSISWKENILPDPSLGTSFSFISEANQRLALSVKETYEKEKFFVVVGGDHSCAVGTWSGVSSALNAQDFGLIWIDAHCDAHTEETTHSGNIHGMPIAVLLGHGNEQLTGLMHEQPKLKPEHLVLIGVRDYEPEEHQFLIDQGTKIYYNTDVDERGIDAIVTEAVAHMHQSVSHYGISFDLDGLDPSTIPAVGTPVLHGVDSVDCLKALTKFATDPKLLGYEIVEFNPDLDKEKMTEKYICDVLSMLVESR